MRVMEHNLIDAHEIVSFFASRLQSIAQVERAQMRFGVAIDITERLEKRGSGDGFGNIDIKRALEGVMNDSVALAKALPKLLVSLSGGYRMLIGHIERGDIGNAKKITRFIWESSRQFGVLYLAKTATQMEQALRDATPSFVEECIITMGMALENLDREVARLCPKI